MNQEMHTLLLPQRPITIFIAAPGAARTDMLAEWLVAAAMDCDFLVQSTSIPGLSQHSDAATHYVEIYPVPAAQLGGRTPAMALSPTAGAIDVVAALELVEAGRALQGTYIDADRTTLVASTHRVITIDEKVMPGDARADSGKLIAALRRSAHHAVLFDMAQLAREHGSTIDAVLFGALAASGALGLPRAACERAIRGAGRSAGADTDASLRGFSAGYASGHAHAGDDAAPAAPAMQPALVPAPVERVHLKFPPETFAVLDAGVARLTDYQDSAYATLYLDRLEPVLALDREAGGDATGYQLTREAGRQLALWMSFEDLIRVADLKTRKNRFERVREEVGAGPGDIVEITEYLNPDLEDICLMLPQRAALPLLRWAQKHFTPASRSFPLQVKTSSLSGFLLLRAVSSLKRWRRRTARYQAEHALIERWLGAIKRLGFAVQDVELACEIAECAGLMQGCGKARRDGAEQFKKIFDTIIESGTESDPIKLRAAIRRARLAAQGNPEAPPAAPQSMNADPGKPIFWMPRATPGKRPDNAPDNAGVAKACATASASH